MAQLMDKDDIRTRFSLALSEMYKKEVPLYADLIQIVNEVDDDIARKQGIAALAPRHRLERHGAIRLGTDEELRTIGRLFAIFGMFPVGYYDLREAGFPLHATAFRPITTEALAKNPFRVFTTLLRKDLLSEGVQKLASSILSRRQLFTSRLLELIDIAEATSSLNESEISELLVESLKIFKWHSTTTVTHHDYELLRAEHPIVADIVCFPSAHINHLTPRTLDIDQVQMTMVERAMPAKDKIEGPPRRACPILLRQTSFMALEERVGFLSANGHLVPGSHTARFGEVEQRGAAVTRKGRELYNEILLQCQLEQEQHPGLEDDDVVARHFNQYPDSWEELRNQGLTFNYYSVDTLRIASEACEFEEGMSLAGLIELGVIKFEPMTYEDFLPISAAGIFKSNLGNNMMTSLPNEPTPDREGFERSLGKAVADEIELYRHMELKSIENCQNLLGFTVPLL